MIWLGTGENVGGRHVGFGDGVYRSADGGANWEMMGLEKSQHLSKIIIHPEDSKTLFVASQGPLWSPGGERGLYKTTDGGATWKNVLSAGEWTGVTDVVMDPRDPDRLYAATWQHHRTVAALIDGGPESGIHTSVDGGETWTRLTEGLPKGNMGKIGLAISPQQPDVLYAAIELDNSKGGVWRSTNRGATWEKRSDAVAGATGPHYYQELVASPHAFDRIYLMDFRVQVSDDGGTTFRRLKEESKHSDNHALVFRADDPNWLLMGTDGGLYESFDLAESWRYIANLPVTQFYKLALDDSAPFYNVYGGTQDNNTQGGPVRTDNVNGITNADWFITLFADGHQPAVEPGNPEHRLLRVAGGQPRAHRPATGGIVYIQPQPEPGDPPERFNWDAPILISPHSPTRLYYGSQRVWRSDDRGDSWTPVSPDLTKNEDRMLLPLMGRQWSSTAPWDFKAMSAYNTITSLAESPVEEGVLWAGTDDGLIQVSSDGGGSWKAIPVGDLPGVPDTAFVNNIVADLFDADTAYVALDNHKYGDFRPFARQNHQSRQDLDVPWPAIFPSAISSGASSRTTSSPTSSSPPPSSGLFFTVDGGSHWIRLEGGVPTISFRDLAIQRRENDLVGASFGRGFFVFDDYTPLRHVSTESPRKRGRPLPGPPGPVVRPTPTPRGGRPGIPGRGLLSWPTTRPSERSSPTTSATEIKTLETQRREAEKELEKEWKDTPYVGYDALEAERRQPEPEILLTVRDADGRDRPDHHRTRQEGLPPGRLGSALPLQQCHRACQDPIEPWERGGSGHMAPPGSYTVSLSKRVDGMVTELAGPAPFEVIRVFPGTLEGTPPAATAAYMAEVSELRRAVSAADEALKNRLWPGRKARRGAGSIDHRSRHPRQRARVAQTEALRCRFQARGQPLHRRLSVIRRHQTSPADCGSRPSATASLTMVRRPPTGGRSRSPGPSSPRSSPS